MYGCAARKSVQKLCFRCLPLFVCGSIDHCRELGSAARESSRLPLICRKYACSPEHYNITATGIPARADWPITLFR